MNEAEKKVRFVLVGCGKISRNHVAGVKRLGDLAELVAVCDPVEERAQAAADAAGGAAIFTDMDAMFTEVEADCAIIGTPSGLHPEHTAKAAQAGFHVVTEKPMAVNVQAADAMLHAVQAAGRELFVIKQNRLLPTVQALQASVEAGHFGKLYMGQVNVFWTRPQAYYDEAPWRGTWAMDGGAFLNQASHYIDLLQWLLGPVESVQAFTDTLARDIEAEDSGVAILRFASGAIGSINVTMLTYPKNLEGSLTLLGERGTVKLSGRGLSDVVAWDIQDEETPTDFASPPSEPGAGHAPYFRNVVEVLRHGAQPATPGREARKSLEIIEAAYRSSKEGTRISLPLKDPS